MLRLLQVLALLLVPALASRGDLSAFNWTNIDESYIATGIYRVQVTATGAGPVTEVKPDAAVELCVSASAIVFTTTGLDGNPGYGVQYVLPGGYYYVNTAGNCAWTDGFGVAEYAQHYGQLSRTRQHGKRSGYVGAVVDPGQNGTYSAAEIETNEKGQVEHYTLAGTVLVPVQVPVQVVPGGVLYVVVKTIQDLDMTITSSGRHIVCPSLPAACTTPTNYSAQYAPRFNPITGLLEDYTLSV